MATTSTHRPTQPDSKYPICQPNFFSENHLKKLKAIGYMALAVITAVALLILCTLGSFLGGGAILAPFYAGGGLEHFIAWYSNSFWISLIAAPILSYYPIQEISGSFFKKAVKLWTE